MNILFVYGTLKSGFNRHPSIQEQRYLGTAWTASAYRMFAYGGFPALIAQQSPEAKELDLNKRVFGELYEVSHEAFFQLDKVEGVDSNLFARHLIKLDEITLFRPPLYKTSWDQLQKKEVQSYVFMQKVNGAAEIEEFWAKK